jgi:hypothetical protein
MGTGHDGAGLRPNLEPSASVEAFEGPRTPLPPLAGSLDAPPGTAPRNIEPGWRFCPRSTNLARLSRHQSHAAACAAKRT